MSVIYVLGAFLITLPIAAGGLYTRKNAAGIAFCVVMSIPAWHIGQRLPIIGAPVAGILIGILASNLFGIHDALKSGIQAGSKKILQMAIVLLGFQMNLNNLMILDVSAMFLIASVMIASFLVASFVGAAAGVSSNGKILVGVGSAICGGSAIAAAAPVVEASDEEVASAISTIFLFNVIAALVFPAMGRLMGMSDVQFGMWAGSAINDTSSVVAAGYSFSETAGKTAIIVKLVRTLMIIPVVFGLAFFLTRSGKQAAGSHCSFIKIFPWFVVGFLLACVANSINMLPSAAMSLWGQTGRFLIITAMVAIGCGANLKTLLRQGGRTVFLGFCCAVSVTLVSLFILLSSRLFA